MQASIRGLMFTATGILTMAFAVAGAEAAPSPQLQFDGGYAGVEVPETARQNAVDFWTPERLARAKPLDSGFELGGQALPGEVDAYSDAAKRKFLVRPGMTGLWQVSGRSDLSWEESVRLDLRYVENWSPAMDLVILCKTVSAVFRGDGAY